MAFCAMLGMLCNSMLGRRPCHMLPCGVCDNLTWRRKESRRACARSKAKAKQRQSKGQSKAKAKAKRKSKPKQRQSKATQWRGTLSEPAFCQCACAPKEKSCTELQPSQTTVHDHEWESTVQRRGEVRQRKLDFAILAYAPQRREPVTQVTPRFIQHICARESFSKNLGKDFVVAACK